MRNISNSIINVTLSFHMTNPDSKVHVANMGPTWVLSAPDGPHVGPTNLATREVGEFQYSSPSNDIQGDISFCFQDVHQMLKSADPPTLPQHAILWKLAVMITSLIARFMGPTCGPSGADRTQVGPMLVPWTLLSGVIFTSTSCCDVDFR